ncbi:hypothetical protein AX16_007239 [Volvariella volvacea WC 439]|nr:hypothetical protein AX16_007239 [Volvariella volvacea WC 439]
MRDRTKSLRVIEQLITAACAPTSPSPEAHDHFLALQYTFECNVPTRILPWLATSTLRLELLTNKGSIDDDQEVDAVYLASQLSLALSLIQGIALNHPASKAALGRKYALEILLDLLLASRYLSAIPVPNPGPNSEHPGSHTSTPPLTSVVLDTLLCILVDSSQALRTFEEVQGVQVVVKILKRAGTPREVRMKCLEFLYFYLLDESPMAGDNDLSSSQSTPHTPAPQQQSRVSPKKPYVNGFAPNLPSTRRPSISSSIFPSSELSLNDSSSSRSTSTSSHSSHSSVSSVTSASSVGSVPFPTSNPQDKQSALQLLQNYTRQQQQLQQPLPPSVSRASSKTPPQSPPPSSRSSRIAQTPVSRRAHRDAQLQLQTKPLHMFNKDVDYTPLSPQKPSAIERTASSPSGNSVSGMEPSGIPHTPLNSHNRIRSSDSAASSLTGAMMSLSERSGPAHSRGKSLSALSKGGGSRSLGDVNNDKSRDLGPAFVPRRSGQTRDKENSPKEVKSRRRQNSASVLVKTTEQKKEYLGTMLGNVDALVEGVRKAGIWGLG